MLFFKKNYINHALLKSKMFTILRLPNKPSYCEETSGGEFTVINS